MREWLVASGIVEGPDGLLLVQNRRRNGSVDWSTPGGVIEVEAGESVLEGLTREVREETGITVTEWHGPVYEVEAVAEGLGWQLRVEVHRAVSFFGDLVVDDLDGIVVDARWVPVAECEPHLDACPLWVREPLSGWLGERPDEPRSYRYRVEGADRASLAVVRL
ncbi:MAG TPA: NUDIX hydrolase [Acidimicrobiales bacterium]|nr:NUDIX hydrolase [Acidimicrobiales bacterium]